MEKLKDLLPKQNINEAKITAKQLRSDLSDYLNKNSEKIAKEFIPKGIPYFIRNNNDGISFMIGGKTRTAELGNTKSEMTDYVKIDINLGQATGGVPSANYFDKAKINEGSVSNYYSRSESPVRAAAKKIDDFLKTLITDKKELNKLTDLISDLADEYAQERIDDWDMGKLDEGLEDMDISLPSKLNMFLDRTINIVKNYNLPRAKEQLVIAKLINALNMNPSELNNAVSKLKKNKIVNR